MIDKIKNYTDKNFLQRLIIGIKYIFGNKITRNNAEILDDAEFLKDYEEFIKNREEIKNRKYLTYGEGTGFHIWAGSSMIHGHIPIYEGQSIKSRVDDLISAIFSMCYDRNMTKEDTLKQIKINLDFIDSNWGKKDINWED